MEQGSASGDESVIIYRDENKAVVEDHPLRLSAYLITLEANPCSQHVNLWLQGICAALHVVFCLQVLCIVSLEDMHLVFSPSRASLGGAFIMCIVGTEEMDVGASASGDTPQD